MKFISFASLFVSFSSALAGGTQTLYVYSCGDAYAKFGPDAVKYDATYEYYVSPTDEVVAAIESGEVPSLKFSYTEDGEISVSADNRAIVQAMPLRDFQKRVWNTRYATIASLKPSHADDIASRLKRHLDSNWTYGYGMPIQAPLFLISKLGVNPKVASKKKHDATAREEITALEGVDLIVSRLEPYGPQKGLNQNPAFLCAGEAIGDPGRRLSYSTKTLKSVLRRTFFSEVLQGHFIPSPAAQVASESTGAAVE